jgi:ABC-type nitrate/sulfonate/bicarbonate transport system permease component
VVLPSIALVLLLLLWDWAVRHYEIPSTLLARPGEVLGQLWYGTRSGALATTATRMP